MMARIRRHLTYANVVSTIGVFLLLAGGTAIAAKKLGKNTVGPRQLKANSVTTKKIKKNSVTRAKLRAGAVDGSKLAAASVSGDKIVDGAVSGAKIDTGSTVFGRRVARLASSAVTPVTGATVYPVGAYIQPVGEDDQPISSFDVRFGAGCGPPRTVGAYLLIDSPNPKAPVAQDIAGYVMGEDKASGEAIRRYDFRTAPGIPSSGDRAYPDVATPHSFDVYVFGGGCGSGGGIDVVGAIVDVIGTR